MIAVPIGPRAQRFATAAVAGLSRPPRPPRTPARSARPRLPARPVRQRRDARLGVRARRRGRAGRSAGPLMVRVGAATDLAVDAAVAGIGVIQLFEDWLRRISTAARWSPCWSPGGRASRARSSIIPAAATCPRRCAPSSTSSPRCGGGDFGLISRRQMCPGSRPGPYEYLYQRQCVGNFNGPLFRFWENGDVSMNRIAETFRIALALVLGGALAIVVIPIVAIVCFSILALLVTMRRLRRQHRHGDVVSRFTRKAPAAQSPVPPTIETTYTVVHPS